LFINSNSTIEIDKSQLVFKNKSEQAISLRANDIESIELSQAASVHGINYSLAEAYHYA
jgi:hypothetical protein